MDNSEINDLHLYSMGSATEGLLRSKNIHSRQQDIRNSGCDFILGSLILNCYINTSSSLSKRENSCSMVPSKGY